jgi:hypothetical protein
MIFDKNEIVNYCDGRFYASVPTGIDFSVKEQVENVKLTAPGYGGEPYGNGAIHIKKTHFDSFLASEIYKGWLQ